MSSRISVRDADEGGSVRAKKRILVLGLGGAGCNILAQIAPGAPSEMEFAAADCDAQSLDAAAGVQRRLLIGESLTEGMSAGGDPETGRRCAQKSEAQLETLLSGNHLLLVICGLGGGFGAGSAPVAARIARQLGIATLFFAVLPFPCEGMEAQKKAQQALHRMRVYADAIVQMPNAFIQPDGDRLFSESLERSSRTLAEGVVGLWRMLHSPGVCNLDFISLHTMIHYCDAYCRFACATASGDQRMNELIHSVRSHPLVQDGSVFEKAPGMIIGITGGDDLKLSEVQGVVEGISSGNQACWLKTGVALDPSCTGQISVFVLAAESWKEPLIQDGEGRLRPVSSKGKQGEFDGFRTLSHTPVAEPTIWNGEDLDQPAYLRRKIKLPR